MLADIVLPGWVPFYGINLSEDVPGYIAVPGRRAGLPVEAPHRGAAWAGCAPATMSTCTSTTLGRPAPDPLLPVKNDTGGERHGMAGAAAGF
jgi:hypothetical protein